MVGTNEQYASAMGKTKNAHLQIVPPEEPPLSDLDRVVIGRSVRVDIPFDVGIFELRKMPPLLRELADAIEFQSHRTDHPPLNSPRYVTWRRSMQFELKQIANAITRKLKALRGKRDLDR